MKLCYRGTSYQPTTTLVDTVASNVTARFLGKTYTVRQASCPIVSQPNLYQYRGVRYGKIWFGN